MPSDTRTGHAVYRGVIIRIEPGHDDLREALQQANLNFGRVEKPSREHQLGHLNLLPLIPTRPVE
jgi:hypothetical protein